MKFLMLVKGNYLYWNNLPNDFKQKVITEFKDYASYLHSNGYLISGDGCGENSFLIKSSQSTMKESEISSEKEIKTTGYFIIEANDNEHAFELAKQCPAFNCNEHIELIPIGH